MFGSVTSLGLVASTVKSISRDVSIDVPPALLAAPRHAANTTRPSTIRRATAPAKKTALPPLPNDGTDALFFCGIMEKDFFCGTGGVGAFAPVASLTDPFPKTQPRQARQIPFLPCTATRSSLMTLPRSAAMTTARHDAKTG